MNKVGRPAERTGLLEKLEREANSEHDAKRKALADDLLELVATREQRLAPALATAKQTTETRKTSEAIFRADAQQEAIAWRAVSDNQNLDEYRERVMRSALDEIAPSCLHETYRKLDRLHGLVLNALQCRTYSFTNPSTGMRGFRDEGNIDTVRPPKEWLEHAMQEVRELSHTGGTAEELAALCTALLQDARSRVVPILNSAAVADVLDRAQQ